MKPARKRTRRSLSQKKYEENHDQSPPLDVVESVLSFLPIEDLTRLSVLSKRFRYSWRFCRDLCFDANFAIGRSRIEIVNIIHKVLHYHAGTKIDRFKLYFNPAGAPKLVITWIFAALMLGVEEIDLDFTPAIALAPVPKISFSEAKDLKIMKLRNCDLEFPPKRGFYNLRFLKFEIITLLPSTIQSIFSSCLLLETLHIARCRIMLFCLAISANKKFKTLIVEDCMDVYSMEITAPGLETFHYHGNLCEIHFDYREMLNLNDVILNFAPTRCYKHLKDRNNLVTSLTFVTTLTISSAFFENLAPRYMNSEYNELQVRFWNLKEFQLIIQGLSHINPYDIAIFLKTCPRVQRIFIDLGDIPMESGLFWETHAKPIFMQSKPLFPYLKFVKVKGFKLMELEGELVRYFLRNATNLESAILVGAKKESYLSYAHDLLLQGIDTNAQIYIYEHLNDDSKMHPRHLQDECK